MKIEKDIIGTKSTNRHMAEERNQVPLQEEFEQHNNKNDDEEAKYGATDRRNKIEVANQDGGVFKSTGVGGPKNAKKKKVNKFVTAPEGKFKNFHQTIQRDGLKQLTEAFVRDFTQKKPDD